MMMDIPFSRGFFAIYIYNIFHNVNSIQKYTEKVMEACLDLFLM